MCAPRSLDDSRVAGSDVDLDRPRVPWENKGNVFFINTAQADPPVQFVAADLQGETTADPAAGFVFGRF